MFPDALDVIPNLFSNLFGRVDKFSNLLLDFIKASFTFFYDLLGSIARSLGEIVI